MKIAVLGSGMVGTTIGRKLVSLGHEVRLGSREANNEKGKAWVTASGPLASQGTFADAATFGELIFNCTLGTASLAALEAAGASSLRGKVLIDVSNPLDFSQGMPPTLFTGNGDSLGEQIQRKFPDALVVKTLNTVNCEVMIDPARVANGNHDMFLSGNDAGAKAKVVEVLRGWFGWKNVVDLGDIKAARATESYLLLWLRLWGALKTGDFNVKVVS